MEKVYTWLYIALAVGVAVAANAISTVWAKGDDRYSVWLVALILISPVVFITFGLVVARTGLVVGAGTIDALLTVSTILLGLFVFKEWSTVTTTMMAGVGLTLTGLVLLHVSK